MNSEAVYDVDPHDIMRAMRDGGMSDVAIALAFGVSRERIGQVIGRRGPDTPATLPPALAGLPSIEELHAVAADEALPGALRAWRETRGLPQAVAASRFGISLGAWNGWETRRRPCKMAGLVLRLLIALDQIETLKTP